MPPLTTHQEVTAGADSVAANGNALTWASEHWPDLAGATLTLTVGRSDYNFHGNLPVTWTGQVPASPDNPASVSLDVSAAQTAVLNADEYDYALSAKLTNGTVYSVALGKLTVFAAPSAIAPYPPA